MHPFLRIVVAAGLALMPFTLAQAADAVAPAKKKVLFFSKSSGFEHDAIKLEMKDGKPGYAFAVLRQLGEKNNIEFTFSKDGSLFTPDYLAQFDAYFFYTTGNLTEPGTDRNPPMTEAGKAAFLKAIAEGKGFVGTHSASDTFHSPGNKDHGAARNQADGDKADDYVKMLGAEFIKHGAQQPARQIVADATFPGLSAVTADFGPNEEWYSLKNYASDLHVLLVQDVSKMKGDVYERPNYPSTWTRMHGKGRVFYTSMGHRDDVWTNPVFQTVLEGGLNWALKRVDADVTPNLATAAPKANELPAFVAPAPAKPKTPAPGTPKAPNAPKGEKK